MDGMELFKKLAQCEEKEQMQRCIEEYRESQKPKTNADRIRAMSDEELAKFLDDTNLQGCVCPARDCRSSCHKCIQEWLQEPAEE